MATDGGGVGLTLIDGLPVGGFSLGALVTLGIVMIFTGRLVPKRHLDASEERERKQAAINETNAATLIEMKIAINALVEVGRTTDQVIRSIQARRDRGQEQEATS